jgi:DNA-directed RNA polymerase subunit RPC12/RpoP
MSKYEDEYEDDGYKCPYCSYHVICDDWGFDYDGEEEECEECGKKYIATASHSVSFDTKPDCKLNGEKHDLEYNSITDCYFCKTCGKCILKKYAEKTESEKVVRKFRQIAKKIQVSVEKRRLYNI